MINSKENIKKIAVFEFEGQLISKSINFIINWIDSNITNYYEHKILYHLTVGILQSFSRLSEYKDLTDDFKIILGKGESKYYIFFSKIVLSKKLLFIDEEISTINKNDLEKIKLLFKEIMCSAKFSERSSYYLTLIELKRKSREDISFKRFPYDNENSVIEIVVSFQKKWYLKRRLTKLFNEKPEYVDAILSWHKKKDFQFENELTESIETLLSKPELDIDKKFDLLINPDFFRNK